MSSSNETADRSQYLSFSLAGGEYGIEILNVKEILQYEDITRVPSTPAWMRGVINVRGSVVPVIDLAVKFGFAETPVTKRTCILVFETNIDGIPTVLGLMTDSVTAVIELAPADIEETPSFDTRVSVEYLLGMGKVGKGFVLLLDLAKVLSADEHDLVRDAAREDLASPLSAPEALATGPDTQDAPAPGT